MNWLSFFIGVLVGWIVAWLIDLFYWRRKCRSALQEKEALKARLDEAQMRIGTKDSELEAWRQRMSGAGLAVEGAEIKPPDMDVDVDLKAPKIELPRADLDVDLKAPQVELPHADLDVDLKAPKAELPRADLDIDLKTPKVELPHLGVGAAIDDLKTDLSGWPAEMPVTMPDQRDNLKKIEGIGPKIARLLNDSGILTFAQLAAASTDRLKAILREAGPNYQLADPGSWPEQARLAADGAWDELQALQDRLTGGRKALHRDS